MWFRFAIDVMQLSESMIHSSVLVAMAPNRCQRQELFASESASIHWAQTDVPVMTDLTDVYSILFYEHRFSSGINRFGRCLQAPPFINRAPIHSILSQLTKLIKKITARSHIEPMKINFFSWFIECLFAINTAPCRLQFASLRFNFQVKMIFIILCSYARNIIKMIEKLAPPPFWIPDVTERTECRTA